MRSLAAHDLDASPLRLRLLTPAQIMLLVGAVDAADSALLMGSFPAFQAAFSFTPSRLGALMMVQGIAGSVALPLWGCLLPLTGYKRLLVPAVALWSATTFLTTRVSTFYAHAAIRVVNGAALSCVTPLAQSLLARSTAEANRGRAFGTFAAAEKISSMVVTYAVVASGNRWRSCYLATTVATSLLLVLLVACLRVDLGRQGDGRHSVIHAFAASLRAIVAVPSFFVLVAQGVVGSTPWRAMAFFNLLWLSSGFSKEQAATIGALAQFGSVLGSIAGGVLGDIASARRPSTGRPMVAQLSVLCGIPLWVWWLRIDKSAAFAAAVGFAFYFFATWPSVAANRPICAQLFTNEADRANVLALLVFLESGAASVLGGPVMGTVSEWYGYRLDKSVNKLRNAFALRSALTNIGVLMWSLCFLCWTFMYYTLPRDRARASKETASQERLDFHGASLF